MELVIVLALLAVFLLVAAPSLRAVFGVDLHKAAREMASTLRYVQDEATLRNVTMRIAYDLDNNRWWVEAADGPARIFRNRDEKEAFAEFMAAKAESDERVAEEAKYRRSGGPSQQEIMTQIFGEELAERGAGGGGMGMLGGLLGGGGFSPAARGGEYQVNNFRPVSDINTGEDKIFEPRKLPGGVFFLGAWTPQHEEIVEPLDEYELEAMLREEPEDQQWTIVYTHMFAGGYSEDTVLYIGNEEGDYVRSITVEPLTRRIVVTPDRAELPDLREREQRQ